MSAGNKIDVHMVIVINNFVGLGRSGQLSAAVVSLASKFLVGL